LPEENIADFAVPAKPPIDDGAEMTRIIDYVAQESSIKTVILSAYWSSYGVDVEKLTATLKTFADSGEQVFVTEDSPDFSFSPDQCKYGISPIFPTARCSQDSEDFETKYSIYAPRVEQAVNQVPAARLLETAKYFCDESTCNMTSEGNLLFADGDHLNHQGRTYLFKQLLRTVPEITQ